MRFILFSTLSCVLWAQGPAAEPAAASGDPVVLSVGEEKLTRSQFEALISALPANTRQQLATPAARRQFAERLVEMKALAQEARRRKLQDKPEVRAQLRLTEDNLLANSLFQELLEGAAITEASAREYYEAHKSEYETARARHILVRFKGSRVPLREGTLDRSEEEALAHAAALRDRVVKGEDFAGVARADSDDTGSGAQGGDLGEFGRGRMVPVFDQAAFSLPVGEVSEPVKSQFGYHVIQVQARKVKPFEEVRPEIERTQKPEAARKASDEIRKKAGAVLEESYFGEALAAPAKQDEKK